MKVLVAIPCMDSINTIFFTSVLRLLLVGDVEYSVTTSSLIYDARNALARKAVEEGFDRVLWLDSDMVFEPDLMQRLSARLDEGYDMVTGLYFKRRQPVEPVIYKSCGSSEKDGILIPFAEAYNDYPDGLFPVAACGFGGVMMKTELIREVAEKYGLPFSPILGFGEDLSFCCKVAKLGHAMYCDSTIKLGHVGFKEYNEKDFILRGIKQWQT